MDKMQLKLNSHKTECILFRSKHQLNKAAKEPLKLGPDLIELSDNVKYLGGDLDNTPTLNHMYLLRCKRQWLTSSK